MWIFRCKLKRIKVFAQNRKRKPFWAVSILNWGILVKRWQLFLETCILFLSRLWAWGFLSILLSGWRSMEFRLSFRWWMTHLSNRWESFTPKDSAGRTRQFRTCPPSWSRLRFPTVCGAVDIMFVYVGPLVRWFLKFVCLDYDRNSQCYRKF